MDTLPLLIPEDFNPTRDCIQDIVKVLGSLQLVFLPINEHGWQYGLEVTMRGISTQEIIIGDQSFKASLDLVRHKVRIGETNWSLEEYAAPEILDNIKVWFAAHGQDIEFEKPTFTAEASFFDTKQATMYAEALWWLEEHFKGIKSGLNMGLTSPILLYPHHFDMALTWFPQNDDAQLSLGFSTGDETIKEPYLYLTSSPEDANFTGAKLPPGAYWQTDNFSGAILPYAALQAAEIPDALFDSYASLILRG